MKTNRIKIISAILILFIFFGCSNDQIDNNQSNSNIKNNSAQDLGSIMLDIQSRHTKLYYAGENENWELASFFVQELKESFNNITMYHRSHDEVNINKLTNKIMMPTLEKLESVTEKEDIEKFKASFTDLTTSCNNCHSQSKHAFIKIKTPLNGDFLNQDFGKQ